MSLFFAIVFIFLSGFCAKPMMESSFPRFSGNDHICYPNTFGIRLYSVLAW